MSKQIFYGDDARKRILNGAEILFKAVASSYGPRAGNAVIDRGPYYDPLITHDGVTIAKRIEIDDTEPELLGARVGLRAMRKASEELNLTVGDGTSSALILAYFLFKESTRLIAAGVNAQDVRKGVEGAANDAVAKLETLAINIEADSRDVEQIASVSSSGDKEISELLADVVKKVGKDGTISVEIGRGEKTEAEIVDGFSFDYGFISPDFINNVGEQCVSLENAAIVLVNGDVTDATQLVPLFNSIMQTGTTDIAIIADNIEKSVISELVKSKVNGVISPVAIKAPGFGKQRKEYMEDIATFTGAKLIDVAELLNQSELPTGTVGKVEKLIVEREKTTLFNGGGTKETVQAKAKEILAQKTDSALEKAQFERRAARLSGKVAVIKVGGYTDAEASERKDRVDDAVGAVKAALKGGIVPGGGTTFLYLSKITLDPAYIADGMRAGHRAFISALSKPIELLFDNAGFDAATISRAINEIRESEFGRGVDISLPDLVEVSSGTGTPKITTNLIGAGIIDPALVIKEVIRTAVSISATLSTVETLAVEIPEKTIAKNA